VIDLLNFASSIPTSHTRNIPAEDSTTQHNHPTNQHKVIQHKTKNLFIRLATQLNPTNELITQTSLVSHRLMVIPFHNHCLSLPPPSPCILTHY
jgi:hypothetical protein